MDRAPIGLFEPSSKCLAYHMFDGLLKIIPCERGLKAVVPFWETPEVTGREDEVKWREDLEA